MSPTPISGVFPDFKHHDEMHTVAFDDLSDKWVPDLSDISGNMPSRIQFPSLGVGNTNTLLMIRLASSSIDGCAGHVYNDNSAKELGRAPTVPDARPLRAWRQRGLLLTS